MMRGGNKKFNEFKIFVLSENDHVTKLQVSILDTHMI